MSEMGFIHIYCGDGKGKTSAAIGLAIRAAGREMKVVIARFLKHDDSGEVAVLGKIPEITLLRCEKSFGFFSKMTSDEKEEAKDYYTRLFNKACKMAENADVLILDEIIAACNYGLVDENEILSFLRLRNNIEIVMTGRNPSDKLKDEADYISEIKKLRHPYDRGINARTGVEY